MSEEKKTGWLASLAGSSLLLALLGFMWAREVDHAGRIAALEAQAKGLWSRVGDLNARLLQIEKTSQSGGKKR